MNYTVHDTDSAPEAARPLLEAAREKYGFVPNILGIMAESPALLEAYMAVSGIFEKTRFSTAEKQVVLLAVSTENGCGYCRAAHAGIARMQNVDAGVIDAIQNDQTLPDAKLDVLFRFTRHMVRTRGRPEPSELQAFQDAGYDSGQVQEVILGIGMKTLSNYNNHIADTPVDEAFGGSGERKAG